MAQIPQTQYEMTMHLLKRKMQILLFRHYLAGFNKATAKYKKRILPAKDAKTDETICIGPSGKNPLSSPLANFAGKPGRVRS